MGLFTGLNLKPSSQFDGVRLEGLEPEKIYTGKLTGEAVIKEYDGFDLPYIEVVLSDETEPRWLKLSLSNSDEDFFEKYEAAQLKGCNITFETALYKEYLYIYTTLVDAPKASTQNKRGATSKR